MNLRAIPMKTAAEIIGKLGFALNACMELVGLGDAHFVLLIWQERADKANFMSDDQELKQAIAAMESGLVSARARLAAKPNPERN